MFRQKHAIALCMCLCIAAPATVHAQEPARGGPDAGPDEARPWADPPPPSPPPAETDERSRDRQAALGVRVRLLEERITALSRALKAKRDRGELTAQADAALREVEALRVQARVEQNATFRLTARAEGLRKQLAAIARERGEPGALTSAAVPATGVPPPNPAPDEKPFERTARSASNAGRTKVSTSAANRPPADAIWRRSVRQAQNDPTGYRPENRRAFVLPSVLRPIRF